MLRNLLLLAIPLLLPVLVYFFVCLGLARVRNEKIKKFKNYPFITLGLIGLGLVTATLVAYSFSLGTKAGGTYIPPHTVDGKVIPGRTIPPPE